MTVEHKILPASAGLQWISQAVVFGLSYPWPLALTTFFYLLAVFIAALLEAIPFIGWIVSIGMFLVTPAMTLGCFLSSAVLNGANNFHLIFSFDP